MGEFQENSLDPIFDAFSIYTNIRSPRQRRSRERNQACELQKYHATHITGRNGKGQHETGSKGKMVFFPSCFTYSTSIHLGCFPRLVLRDLWYKKKIFEHKRKKVQQPIKKIEGREEVPREGREKEIEREKRHLSEKQLECTKDFRYVRLDFSFQAYT